MSLNFWKSLGSPCLSQSSMTLKAFNGCTYKPCGIINNLHVELGEKMNVDVEVVDGPLDYNILLGRPWVYAMTSIVSTYFRMISFPYKGTITVINQLSFFASTSQVTGSVPFVNLPQLEIQNIGVGLLKDSTLMGTFALPPPTTSAEIESIETCYMISSTPSGLRKRTGDSEIVTLDDFFPPIPIKLA